MGLFSKKTNILKCPLIFLDGISSLVPQTQCIISLEENMLIIETIDKSQRFELDFSQVITLKQVAHQETIQKKKNVITRGIIGSALLGPSGAIIGSVSGLGTKENSQIVYDLIITYMSTNTNDVNTIIFRSLNYGICNSIIEKVNEKISNKRINTKL